MNYKIEVHYRCISFSHELFVKLDFFLVTLYFKVSLLQYN